MKALLTLDINGDCGVTVYRADDGRGVIRWTDYLVNEWSEEYDTVSLAIARAAALYACGEESWDKGFVGAPTDFAFAAREFIRQSIA